MSYPPEIRADTFPMEGGVLINARGRGRDMPTLGATGCREETSQTCKLTSLQIRCGTETSVSYQDPDHGPVAPDGRFTFAPSADEGTILWNIEHPELVTGGTLRVFSARHRAAVWRRRLNAEELAKLSLAEWKGDIAGAAPALFPDGFLTVAHAPYKLHLTIDGPTEEGFSEAWTYFDVVVSSITLEFGSPVLIPPGRADVADRWKRQVLTWEREIVQTLSGNPITDDQTIYLESDLYTTNLTDQGRTDTPYRAYKDLWGDGPFIPLVARVKVKSAAGAEVDAPEALGGAAFLWDWEDRTDDKADRWRHGETTRNVDLVRDALDYRVALEAEKGWAPAGSTNCHRDHGGKRGEGAQPVFPYVRRTAYTPTTPGPLGGQFPFMVVPSPHRKWASLTRARSRTGGYLAGCTGALFQPSRMAGDSYRVSVYLEYGDGFPYDADGADLRRNPPTPHASTGMFEVMRKATCTVLKKHATVPNLDQAEIEEAFQSAGIKLDFTDAGVVDDNDWDAAFQATATTYAQHLRLWWPFMLEDDQIGPHAVEFHPVDQAAAQANALAQTLHGQCHELVTTGFQGARIQPNDAIVKVSDPTKACRIICVEEEGNEIRMLVRKDNVAWPDGAQAKLRDTKTLANLEYSGTVLEARPASAPTIDAYLARAAAQVTGNDTTGVATRIQDFLQHAYLQRRHDPPVGAYMFLYKDKCPDSVERAVSGGASSKTASEGHANIYTCYNTDKVGGDPTKRFTDVVIHELGHGLYLPHASPTGFAECHVAEEGGSQDCVMNYEEDTRRFCGLCLLRLRGWSIYGKAGDDVNAEAHLVQMSGEPNQNSAHFHLDDLRAQVPVTPPKTERTLHNSDANNRPDPPAPFSPAKPTTDDFATNTPLVLLTDGIGPGRSIELQVGTVDKEAAHEVVWTVERGGDDVAGVIAESANAVPTLAVDPLDRTKATLKADATGSFHVRVSVNTTGATAWMASPKALCLNLVLVKVKRVRENHVITGRYCGISVVTTGTLDDIMLHTQKSTREGFDYGDKVPLHLQTTVQLIGGGDGSRGLERVYGGWVNNILEDRSRAVYRDKQGRGQEKYGLLFRLHRAPGGDLSLLTPGLSAAHPLQDGGGGNLATWGAGTPCLSTSKPKNPVANEGQNATLGREVTFETLDAPMTAWDRRHPGNADGVDYRIREISMHTQFRCYLCFWTTQGILDFRHPPADPGARLYSVLEEVGWDVGGRYECNTKGKTKTREALNVTNTDNEVHVTAVAAETTGIELYPPSGGQVSVPRRQGGTIGRPW